MPLGTITDGPGAGDIVPVLSAHSVVKRFGSTLALAGVDLAVRPGEIVGLVGANGAGKSTLIGVFSGAIVPSEGHVAVDGVRVDFSNPEDAARAGIATVQQDVDLALVPTLTVAENLVLDRIATGALGAFPGRRRIRALAKEVAGEDLAGRDDLPLDLPAERLRTSQKQELLIARALHRGARVLILDEPTAALSITEQRRLHARVRELAAGGTAIIYITHHLAEIAAICDRVVAIREGRLAGEFRRPIASAEVAAAILGPLAAATHSRSQRGIDDSAAVALSVRGVRVRPDTPALDLEVRVGEVLGITGLLGAGKTELLRQLVGADPLHTGEVRLGELVLRPRHPSDAIRAGVGFVPEDRRRDAELPEWSVASNISLPSLRRHVRGGLLSVRAERRAAERLIALLRIVTAGSRAALRSLSGGNRQKVAIARWIDAGSRVLVLDEPFRGVDLGARADISALLRSDTVEAALVASSDPEEILEVADRILVLADGQLVAELRPEEVDENRLAELMVSASVPATSENPS